ncbi:MAG: UvrD-helicase domain-containing protein [Lachnospiraceae bacterium]
MQYSLIESWSKRSKSLFVIGDPDQSIYAFRGSSGRCFQRLAEDFPDAIEIRLKENYRSTSEILACALPVIEKNPGASRILNANKGSGSDVRVVTAFDDFSEGIFIAKKLRK